MVFALRLKRVSALVRPRVARLGLMISRQFAARVDEPMLDKLPDRVPSWRKAVLRSDNNATAGVNIVHSGALYSKKCSNRKIYERIQTELENYQK